MENTGRLWLIRWWMWWSGVGQEALTMLVYNGWEKGYKILQNSKWSVVVHRNQERQCRTISSNQINNSMGAWTCGGFSKYGNPKTGWFITIYKWLVLDDLGGPLFRETPMSPWRHNSLTKSSFSFGMSTAITTVEQVASRRGSAIGRVTHRYSRVCQ